MKCPACKSENPEGMKFCGVCGGALPQPQAPPEMQPIVAVSTAPKPMWLSAHWKGLVAVAIVLVVVLASVGLVYTQPWSKMRVLVYNQNSTTTSCVVYIDGTEKFRGEIPANGGGIVGVWSLPTGPHNVSVDAFYLGALDPYLDGVMDYDCVHQVGALYIKDVFILVSPEEPDLIGDLSFSLSIYPYTATVNGRVYNYGLPNCLRTLNISLQDSRGWSITDTIELGTVYGSGGYVEVYQTYTWPSYFNGQSVIGVYCEYRYFITFA